MQRLSPFVLYLGIVSTLAGGILRVGEAHIHGVGPKSFAALAGLCFLYSIAASLLPKKSDS
ncbi:MAG: hypothetical protein HYT87_00435 [Nitrospirae bacterium]|nr:hypothetical protein [Nitrospirota bacterium]